MPVISFQIDNAALEGLDYLARNGASRADLLRQAVREFVAEHLPGGRVIDMNARAFDEFMTALDAEPTPEEQEGRRRLQCIRYPWHNQS